jgi:hypothetical protein
MKLRTTALLSLAAAGLIAASPVQAGYEFPPASFVIAKRGADDGARRDQYDDRREDRRDGRRDSGSPRYERGDDRGYGYGYERRQREPEQGESIYDDRRGRGESRSDDRRRDERRGDRGERRDRGDRR